MANKPTKTTTTFSSGPAGRGLRVVSRPDSFWRAGMLFTIEPRVLPYSELTEEQADDIKSEPLLAVTEVDVEPPADT